MHDRLVFTFAVPNKCAPVSHGTGVKNKNGETRYKNLIKITLYGDVGFVDSN